MENKNNERVEVIEEVEMEILDADYKTPEERVDMFVEEVMNDTTNDGVTLLLKGLLTIAVIGGGRFIYKKFKARKNRTKETIVVKDEDEE